MNSKSHFLTAIYNILTTFKTLHFGTLCILLLMWKELLTTFRKATLKNVVKSKKTHSGNINSK